MLECAAPMLECAFMQPPAVTVPTACIAPPDHVAFYLIADLSIHLHQSMTSVVHDCMPVEWAGSRDI